MFQFLNPFSLESPPKAVKQKNHRQNSKKPEAYSENARKLPQHKSNRKPAKKTLGKKHRKPET